jgi:hypothetical protein
MTDLNKCSGNCEACKATPANDEKGLIIEFYASHYADSEKTESFCCLVEKGTEEGSWSGRKWFGLKYASYKRTCQGNKIVVSAPLWLLKSKGILNLITKI